jgi:hypothetical protein
MLAFEEEVNNVRTKAQLESLLHRHFIGQPCDWNMDHKIRICSSILLNKVLEDSENISQIVTSITNTDGHMSIGLTPTLVSFRGGFGVPFFDEEQPHVDAMLEDFLDQQRRIAKQKKFDYNNKVVNIPKELTAL